MGAIGYDHTAIQETVALGRARVPIAQQGLQWPIAQAVGALHLRWSERMVSACAPLAGEEGASVSERCRWRIMYYEVRWSGDDGQERREPFTKPARSMARARVVRSWGRLAEVYRVQGWDG